MVERQVESFLLPHDVQRHAVRVVRGQAIRVFRCLTHLDLGKGKQRELFQERIQGLGDLDSVRSVLSQYYGDTFLNLVRGSVRARCEGEIAIGANRNSPVRQALFVWTRGVSVPHEMRDLMAKRIDSKINGNNHSQTKS